MQALLKRVEQLAQQAGRAILAIYQRADAWQVAEKSDYSPVTAADLAAHRILAAGLPEILDLPVLSEEADIPPFDIRARWHRYWLVDPLDGTREFISGNGEFTVNVALIEGGQPVLGVVVVPVSAVTYSGVRGMGAFRDGSPIRVRQLVAGQALVVLASRRHDTEHSHRALANLERHFGGVQLRQAGSSLKFCQIAEGVADCYPRLAPTCEWDTAAAQAVLEAAGGRVMDLSGDTLGYNGREELLNPFFMAVGDVSVPWVDIINSKSG